VSCLTVIFLLFHPACTRLSRCFSRLLKFLISAVTDLEPAQAAHMKELQRGLRTFDDFLRDGILE
jgi:hypothetical protein